MPDNSDYRLVLESEFKRVHETLSAIKEQTTKTNSRVSRLEDAVIDLKLADSKHVLNCPVVPDVANMKKSIQETKENMDKELLEYRFFKKYPKVIVFIIAVIAGVVMYRTFIKEPSLQETLQEKLTTEIRAKEGISKETRSGTINYVDINGRRDSINLRNARALIKKTEELEKRLNKVSKP